jgi:uncharacterized protein with HEPN domain
MQPEARKYLHDVLQAAELLAEFTRAKSFEDYAEDALLRSGVERQFEIIGEALSQLSKVDSETAARISGHRRIIAFRNILIHGYAQVDDRIVWDLVQSRLPGLRDEAAKLLGD